LKQTTNANCGKQRSGNNKFSFNGNQPLLRKQKQLKLVVMNFPLPFLLFTHEVAAASELIFRFPNDLRNWLPNAA